MWSTCFTVFVELKLSQGRIMLMCSGPCRQCVCMCDLYPLFQAPQVPSPGAPGQGPHPYSLAEPALTLETSGKNLTEQNYSNIPHEGKHTPLYERSSPINPAPSGSPNHVDSAYFPGSSTSSSSDNDEGSGGAAKWVVYGVVGAFQKCSSFLSSL